MCNLHRGGVNSFFEESQGGDFCNNELKNFIMTVDRVLKPVTRTGKTCLRFSNRFHVCLAIDYDNFGLASEMKNIHPRSDERCVATKQRMALSNKLKLVNHGHAIKCTISLDAIYVGYFREVLLTSRCFRKGLKNCVTFLHTGDAQLALSNVRKKQYDVVINCIFNNSEWVDYDWNYKLMSLLMKRIYLDDAMNWLNTLGGGYSALGDYYDHHAVEAGRISVKQLRIATEMGDLPIIIRCRLYYGLSLMQRGQLKRAKSIIRTQYSEAKKRAREDLRLHNMCRGLWSKLKFLYQLQRREQSSNSL